MIQRKSTSGILADSFMELLCDSSFEDISVRRITTNCETSRQTFYKHFSDKYALANWIFRENVLLFSSSLGDAWNWRAAMLCKLNLLIENSSYYQKIFRYDCFVESFSQFTSELYTAVISERLSGGSIPSEIEFAIDFFSYEVTRKTALWVTRGFREAPETLCNYFADCIPLSMRCYLFTSTGEAAVLPFDRIRSRLSSQGEYAYSQKTAERI